MHSTLAFQIAILLSFYNQKMDTFSPARCVVQLIYLNSFCHQEHLSESYKERLNFQRARVNEINRNLLELAETWDHGGYPMHINLAMSNSDTPPHHRPSIQSFRFSNTVDVVQRLRQENSQLNKDMCQTNERLVALETERQSLLKKLAPFNEPHTTTIDAQ